MVAMTYIVHGATGAQGAPVLAALTAAGLSATAAVRNTAAVQSHPAVAVDSTSADSLVAAYTGADGVFVHLPVGSPEQQMAAARAIGEAATRARPGRVVFSTSGFPIGVPGQEGPGDVLLGLLAAGGVSHAVLAPKLFLENLLLPVVVGPAREEGVLPYPLREDYAVSWCSHLDVADAAVALLTDTSVSGTIGVGALPALLGADLAAGFAGHLERDVRFSPVTPEEFGRQIIPMFGEAGARPVIDSYVWRATQSGEVIDTATSAQTVLGLTPRTVGQWLRDLGL